jgi:hypothetical protein
MICVYTKGNLDQPLVGFHLKRYHCWSDIIGLSGRYQWIWEVFSTEKIGVWRFNRDIDKFIPFATAIPPTNQHEGITCIIMCIYIYLLPIQIELGFMCVSSFQEESNLSTLVCVGR